jgi:hypothetical protein
MNVTVALLAGGDGAVEEGEHPARQKPRTNVVKSRIMIRSFLRLQLPTCKIMNL